MQKSIIHRRSEIAGDRAVFRAIARGDDPPPVAERPVGDAPLQNQAVGGYARLLIRAGKLIEKEDAGLVFTWQKVGKVKSRPFVLMVERGQAASPTTG